MHHAPLLGSQSHLHALVRDVLAQSENLRSQVRAAAKAVVAVPTAGVIVGPVLGGAVDCYDGH